MGCVLSGGCESLVFAVVFHALVHANNGFHTIHARKPKISGVRSSKVIIVKMPFKVRSAEEKNFHASQGYIKACFSWIIKKSSDL